MATHELITEAARCTTIQSNIWYTRKTKYNKGQHHQSGATRSRARGEAASLPNDLSTAHHRAGRSRRRHLLSLSKRTSILIPPTGYSHRSTIYQRSGISYRQASTGKHPLAIINATTVAFPIFLKE